MNKKAKRYDEGGDIEDESGRGEVTPEQKQAGRDANSFSDAFRAAREAGEKTFEWKGKKYTTELASDKPKAAPKPTATTAAGARMRETPLYKKTMTYKSGGSVSSASKRADGCAIRGKTRA